MVLMGSIVGCRLEDLESVNWKAADWESADWKGTDWKVKRVKLGVEEIVGRKVADSTNFGWEDVTCNDFDWEKEGGLVWRRLVNSRLAVSDARIGLG